jgi:flagellin-like protein
MQLSRKGHRAGEKKRLAISELLGSLIMIAITLVAGAAAFSFVNGQTSASAKQLGASQDSNINYLQEKESIALVNFDNSTGISIYLYNNGAVTLFINSFSIQGPVCILPETTNCATASQISATIVYNAVTKAFTFTGAGVSCAQAGAGGLSSIAKSSLGRVWVNFKSCTFVFAATSSTVYPTAPSPTAPLIDYFTLGFVGQYGSSAKTTVAR